MVGVRGQPCTFVPGSTMSSKTVLITGVSAAGKTLVTDRLLAMGIGERPITATSRAPRPGEIDGKDYFFFTEDEFALMVHPDLTGVKLRTLLEFGIPCEQIIEKFGPGEMLEFALVYNQFKGLPRFSLENTLQRGARPILILDIQGVRTIRRLLGPENVTTIAITLRNYDVARKRILARDPDIDPLELGRRVVTAANEIREVTKGDDFEYLVFNEDGMIEETVAQVVEIIEQADRRVEAAAAGVIP
jgi:guanylate kinase